MNVAPAIQDEVGPERAISIYKNVLSTDPHNVEAHRGLAEIYRKQGQNNRAALAYEMAAQALLAKGQVPEALATVQLIIDMSPDNVARRIRLGEQYAQAQMRVEAVRELTAAASYLRSNNRLEEYERVTDRLRGLQGKSSGVGSPPRAATGRGAASQQTLGAGGAADSQPQRPSAGSPASPSSRSDPSVLIAEADSFLRLGLVDKAVEHLAAALVRNPFLRALREPLVTLYVAQRQYKRAAAELWELLAQCTDQQQEIRFLRYILRLDSADRAARQQLDLLLGGHPGPEGQSEEPAALVSIAAVDSELRQALGSQRPPTDLAVTSVIELGDSLLSAVPSLRAADSSPQLLAPQATPPAEAPDSAATNRECPLPPSATTRPGLAQVEAIAEEIALSSRSFRAELAEIDRCVQAANYDDALRRLNVLASCYPHSQTVRAQVEELEQVQKELVARGDSTEPEQESSLPVSTEIAAAMRALLAPPTPPSQWTPTLTALLSGAQMLRSTIEVVPADIVEVGSSRPVVAKSPGRPPPPPRAQRQRQQRAEASAALRKGAALRERGELAQAIAEFDKALADDAQGARAALLIGHCYRDQNRMPEAIAAFMRGLNMPGASESDLSELFYDLGCAHEQARDAKEAILFFQLALGPLGHFRDAAERITALEQSLHHS
jgi:tetratricopeptide (TPR) repeat protein